MRPQLGELPRHRGSLKALEDNETLVMQSGMPVAVFRTHRLAPRVVMATTNFVRPSWKSFYELQDANLTIFAQYTAAPWEYIGTQGVIQGTFETLRSVGNIHLGGLARGQDPVVRRHGWHGRKPAPRDDDARRRRDLLRR